MPKLEYLSGGQTDLIFLTGLFYFLVCIFNITDQLIKKQIVLDRMIFTIPLFVFFILLLFPKRKVFDFYIDLILCIVLSIISVSGDLSAIPLMFLMFFRITNKKQLIAFIGIFVLSILVGSIRNGFSIPNLFLMVSAYVFMGFKYYYIIHKPVESLKKERKELQDELYKRGPVKPLTDDQIIQKYPFMYHPRDNKYRRIEDIRMLSDGLSSKEIASIAEVEPNTISREFDDLKVNIGVFTDQKITTKEQLIKVCIELGIVEVTFIHR